MLRVPSAIAKMLIFNLFFPSTDLWTFIISRIPSVPHKSYLLKKLALSSIFRRVTVSRCARSTFSIYNHQEASLFSTSISVHQRKQPEVSRGVLVSVTNAKNANSSCFAVSIGMIGGVWMYLLVVQVWTALATCAKHVGVSYRPASCKKSKLYNLPSLCIQLYTYWLDSNVVVARRLSLFADFYWNCWARGSRSRLFSV